MSHLGDRLSALFHGALDHDERDRVHVHLAICAQCRDEAAALRALKRRVAALADAAMDPGLLWRLFGLAEPGEPIQERPRPFPGPRVPRPAFRTFPDIRGKVPMGSGRRRARHVAAGIASLLVVAVGGVSFVAGGSQGAPAPRITPPMEMFTVEHSVTTGEVPLVNPTPSYFPAGTARRGGP